MKMMDWLFEHIFLFLILCVLIAVAMGFYHDGLSVQNGIITVISMAMIFGFYHAHTHFYGPAYQNERLAKRLSREGGQVSVVLTSVKQTNTYLNEMPILEIEVHYEYNKQSYRKKIKHVASFTELSSLQKGARKGAWIDKNNPSIFVLK